MFGISLPELLLVFVVILLVFGPEKLPEAARSFGKLMAQLRKGSDSVRREFYRALYPPPPLPGSGAPGDNPLRDAATELRAVKQSLERDLHPGPRPPPPPSGDAKHTKGSDDE